MRIETTETPRYNSGGPVANIATHEPCNVATTYKGAGVQSVVDKAQKHNIFVKVSFPLHLDHCVGPNVTKSSTSQSHQIRLNAAHL